MKSKKNPLKPVLLQTNFEASFYFWRKVTARYHYITLFHTDNTKMMHFSLQWRHNETDGVSNHQPRDCLLNSLFMHRSKKTSKLRVIGLCAGNSPVTGEFPAQRANNAENVSIWWRHHERCWKITAAPWSACHGNMSWLCLGTNGHQAAALGRLPVILPPVFVQAAVIRSW